MFYIARKTGSGTTDSPVSLYWSTSRGFFSGISTVGRYGIKGYKRLGNAVRVANSHIGQYPDCEILVLDSYNDFHFQDAVAWRDGLLVGKYNLDKSHA